MAAENAHLPERPGGDRSFNEAAANGRGKHSPSAPLRAAPRARFNEAAANGRGKRATRRGARRPPRRFNEAAANGRGKRGARVTFRGRAS